MNLPGFTAEASLGKLTRTYRTQYLYGELAQGQSGMPASIVPTQLEDMEGEEIEVEDVELDEDDVEIDEGGEEA